VSLISPEALAERLSDPAVRVADVRWYLGRPGDGRRAYEAGHIPGAVFLDLDVDLVAPTGPGRHPLPDPGAFAQRLEAAGIGDEHLVVAYDDVGGWVAARLWWMLDDLGHRSAAVLDGGFPAWVSAGLPVSPEVAARSPGDAAGGSAGGSAGGTGARLTLATRWGRVIDRDRLRARLRSVVLLDARAGPRYRGEVEPIDPIAGHIPTAQNAPTDGNLGRDGRFLPAAELRTRFDRLGVTARGADVVTYCGSGVSACHNALAMRLAGLPDPILYPGSWSDWSTAGFPVATGLRPGEPPA
jgi:thiosulfate/3-mercaptopyruvate sulfurtransferase